MGYHGVHLLRLSVELDGLATLYVSIGAGLFFFVRLLHGVLIGLFLDYFSLCRIVPGSMH